MFISLIVKTFSVAYCSTAGRSAAVVEPGWQQLYPVLQRGWGCAGCFIAGKKQAQ
jgi:hypothetical protein